MSNLLKNYWKIIVILLNLFVVGAQRSGSTSLYNYLNQHPEIYLSNPKEPHHFSTDLYRESLDFAEKRKVSRSVIEKYFKYIDDKSYFSLFNEYDGENYVGEASADYLFSSEAAKNIHEYNPESKIIIILRNPIDQLYSWHLHLKNSFKKFDENIELTLEMENKRKIGKAEYPKCFRRPSSVHYHDFINLKEQIRRYLNYFDSSQIKVVILEQLKEKPERIYSNILTEFLDLREIYFSNFEKHNKYKITKSYYIRDLLQSKSIHTLINPIKKICPQFITKFRNFLYDNFVFNTKKQKPKMNQEDRIKLMKDFQSNIFSLNNLLIANNLINNNINLIKFWGYDKI